jgi:hypothetical protein
MTTWNEFIEQAPRTAAVFTRRHAATEPERTVRKT